MVFEPFSKTTNGSSVAVILTPGFGCDVGIYVGVNEVTTEGVKLLNPVEGWREGKNDGELDCETLEGIGNKPGA